MFPLNIIKKMYLKLADARRDKIFLEAFQRIGSAPLCFPDRPDCSFKHSGNCGDIIYALPAMYALADLSGNANARLFLAIDRLADYAEEMKHPCGNVTLNIEMFNMLLPLLQKQKQISECTLYAGQHIDYDMDMFRTYPILTDRGDISRWYFQIFPITYDLSKPWIAVEPSDITKDSIVVARSSRYRAPHIDYSFLKDFPRVFFIGLEDEFSEMKKSVTNAIWLPVGNFCEMAELIAGSKLFIGNQSFPFSLAEALKVNRLLEVYYKVPNVNTSGGNGYMFCFQNCFEHSVKRLYELA